MKPLGPWQAVFESARGMGEWLAGFLLALIPSWALATDSEPRAYSNIPMGLNFLVASYAHTEGNVSFAPAVPIKNGRLTIHSAVLAYARPLDFWGRSGKVDLIFPAAWLSGQADVEGQPRQRDTSGFADPVFRLYVNLYGAPSLTLKEFADYKQDIIVGASFAVSAPAGEYSQHKLVNLGTNRWSFKTELGISKAWGPLIAELAVGGFFFTANTEPFRGSSYQQAPLFAAQGHLIYSFGAGIWAALDANYYSGGRSTTDHVLADDLQQNWRVGATLSFPLSRQQSLKLYGNTGVFTRTGSNYDTIGIAWQYRWGEGL